METGEFRGTLSCGTTVSARPIRPGDGPSLQCGLKRLSPQGNVYRFLQHRKTFTEQELHYLTHCDNIDHFARILAVVDADGREVDAIGVARFVRDQSDPELAEVAIVLVDEWQGRGGGTILLGALAADAWKAGIRRWHGPIFAENTVSRKLLSKFGRLLEARGREIRDETYELRPLRIDLGTGVAEELHRGA